MSVTTAKKIVKQYSQLLNQEHVGYDSIYLFGSYAKGKASKHSDIDVAVVVQSKNQDLFATQLKLKRLAPKVDARIEPIILEKSDFKKDSITIMAHEVQTTGIIVV